MPYPRVVTPLRRNRCAIVAIGDRVVGKGTGITMSWFRHAVIGEARKDYIEH